jgi:hypothetical protein
VACLSFATPLLLELVQVSEKAQVGIQVIAETCKNCFSTIFKFASILS